MDTLESKFGESKPGPKYWVPAILLLIWGVIGVSMYLAEMRMDQETYAAKFGQDIADIRHLIPHWSISGYAVGVWFGLLGTLTLLMRKAFASRLYMISLVGAVIGFFWYIIDPAGRSVMTTGSWVFMLFIWALCVFSIWFAKHWTARGLLK